MVWGNLKQRGSLQTATPRVTQRTMPISAFSDFDAVFLF
jgi:hypothetical protein